MTIVRTIFWFFMILLLLTLGIYVAGIILLAVPLILLFMFVYHWVRWSQE